MLPPKHIESLSNAFEVEAWNYSKGILEVTLRQRVTKYIMVRLIDQKENVLVGITTRIPKYDIAEVSNSNGELLIGIPVMASLLVSDFNIQGYDVLKLTGRGNEIEVTLDKVLDKPQMQEADENISNIPQDVDMEDVSINKLDSVNSLTVLYSIIKSVDYKQLNPDEKFALDKKFNDLVQSRAGNIEGNILVDPYIVTDNSVLQADILSLFERVEQETNLLDLNKEKFETYTKLIAEKIENGGQELTLDQRKQLINLILKLRRILEENEEKFYRNNQLYKSRVDELLNNLANIYELEDMLIESEEEKQQLLHQFLIVMLWAALISSIAVLLLYLISVLRKQKKQLAKANKKVRDINENLEDLVEEKTVSLKMLNKELDTFLYRSSHNLKRPLTSIRGIANIASMTLNTEANDLFDKILSTTTDMEKMIEKLTMINHIHQPVDYQQLDLFVIINRVLDKFENEIKEFDIDCSIKIQEGLVFKSYPYVVELLFLNLIENAIFFSRYTTEERPKLKIKITSFSHNQIKITIEDNGSGIQEDVLDKVWDMFFIGNELSKGNGLGLFIAGKALETLEGKVEIETKYGYFCRFVIELPEIKPGATKLSLENEVVESR
jgi:signal transduction histidine kinase